MPVPLRLLLVEDSEDDAMLLERTLQRAGYELTWTRVETSGAMRAALEERAWDLIVSDHAMPSFCAPAALALARELSPDTPLIILSGEIDLNLAVSLVKDGAQDFIQKSEMARLPAAIERLMRSQAERRERERVNTALRESEARFQTLVASMDDIIFTLDRQGHHTGVYGRWLEKGGFSAEMFMGKTAREVLGDEAGPVHEAAFQRALCGETAVYEWSAPQPGGMAYFQTSLSPILDDGEVIGAVGVGRDITAQKRAEREELRRQGEFRTLVENAPDVIVRFDRDYRHVYANPAVEKEMGRRVEQILGKTHRELGQPPEQAAWSENLIRQVFETRREVVFELKMETPHGTQYYLSRGVPEMDERGEVATALFVHRNITAQKLAAIELEDRIRFETLLSDLSTTFFMEPDGDISALLERSLRRVTEFLGMDRGSLHEISEDGSAFRVAFSYAVPGIPSALPVLASSQFPWYVATLKKNQPILMNRIEDAPPEASVEAEFCRRGGIQSVMVIPLLSGEAVTGALSFIACQPTQPHTGILLQRMRLIGEIFLSAVRHARAEDERNRFFRYSAKMQKAIRAIEAGISTRSGEQFFETIARLLSETLGSEMAMVCEFDEGHIHARTRLVYIDGVVAPNFEYDLAGTPCGRVVSSDPICYPQGVAAMFPQSDLIQRLAVEGYAGAALFDSSGVQRGVIAALFRQPIPDPEFARSAIQIFAARAAAEMERQVVLADLKRSEMRYRNVFETMLNGFSLQEMIYDEAGRPVDYRYLEANPAFERLTGRSAREVVGRTGREIFPGMAQEWIPEFAKVTLTGEPLRFNYRFPDGTRCYEGVAYSPVRGQFATIFNETTEQVNAQREMAEWRQRYELVSAASGQVIYDCDMTNGTIQWGGSVEQVLGYQPEEMNGGLAQWEALIDPRDLAEVQRKMEASALSGAPFTAEYGFRHKDGHSLAILDRGFYGPPATGAHGDGHLTRLIGVMQDMTERRRVETSLRASEEHLKESEEKFRAIIEQNSEGVLLVDENGRIVEWNQAQSRISGLRREDAIGRYFWEVQLPRMLPERRSLERQEQIKRTLLEAMRTGESYLFSRPMEVEIQRVDGTIAHVQQTIFPIRVGDRLLIGSVTRDITERKLAEQQIQALNAELEQRVRDRTIQLEAALKELEAFSYSVSHDLRAPLRHLDGFARILEEDYSDRLDEQGVGYLGRIQEASRHMGQLIEALLNLSRLSRGELKRGTVDLSRLAKEIAAELSQRDPQRAVSLSIQAGLVVQADETLMRAMLENLLGNAWKFTAKKDQARIEFGCQSEEPRVFFVRDNGTGFDMANAGRLFSPFQRLHRAQDFPGTGIGLATVQRIISRHGGRVWAESTLGEGAVFYFTLP